MKLYATIIQVLLLVGVMLVINPVSASGGYSDEYVTYNTHIDISSYIVHKGDSRDIKAELWQELNPNIFGDSWLKNTSLKVTIQNNQNETILNKTIQTNFIGNVQSKFDTKTLPTGKL